MKRRIRIKRKDKVSQRYWVGSFTTLGIPKEEHLKRIRQFNERRRLAKHIYNIDKQLQTAIEGNQREALEKQREESAQRIIKSREKYGEPIFFK